jgi:hypothetical protein
MTPISLAKGSYNSGYNLAYYFFFRFFYECHPLWNIEIMCICSLFLHMCWTYWPLVFRSYFLQQIRELTKMCGQDKMDKKTLKTAWTYRDWWVNSNWIWRFNRIVGHKQSLYIIILFLSFLRVFCPWKNSYIPFSANTDHEATTVLQQLTSLFIKIQKITKITIV